MIKFSSAIVTLTVSCQNVYLEDTRLPHTSSNAVGTNLSFFAEIFQSFVPQQY